MRPKPQPRSRALALFSRRLYSESEIRQKLAQYGCSDNEINTIITEFTAAGLLDDHRFAQAFVSSRTRTRPRSLRHLGIELTQRGISPEIISQVLADETIEDEALISLIQKKSTLSRDKLIAFLLRRGFVYSRVRAKLDEMSLKQ